MLGLLTTICLIAIFFTLWLSGVGQQEKIPETSQKTLQGNSMVQKQSKISESSHTSLSKTSHLTSKLSQSTKGNEKPQASKIDVPQVDDAPNDSQKQEISTKEYIPIFYQATVGQFSMTSTISQVDAQNKAQEVYVQAKEQEQANQQEAERIKQSILNEDPDAQVNIIQQGD